MLARRAPAGHRASAMSFRTDSAKLGARVGKRPVRTSHEVLPVVRGGHGQSMVGFSADLGPRT